MRISLSLLVVICVCTYADVRVATIVNGGVYKIQSDNDQSVISADDNGMVSKVLGKVKADAWKNSDEQKWTIRNSPASGGTLILRTITSRKNANNGISLKLPTPGSTPMFRYWEIKDLGNGKWQIKSNPDGLCLQNMGRGRELEEKPCLSTNRNQKWELLICNSLRCSDRRRR